MASTTTSSRRVVASAPLRRPAAPRRLGDGPARVAEARHCLSQSHRFVGACMSYRNCEGVCRTEGFPWGVCRWHGIERKCYCKWLC
ncbi:hypothetical protein PVAP13_7NG359016 [Panicum virgatum]|uniref:Knottins-like domain-containing protein n=1 Tax=Panicum virgatum TaxID=38727 RepID=A0A8T0PZZ6_PANVG|nr:hypothetical protein PVAP13_7NG359016 [Panicum virgatum]